MKKNWSNPELKNLAVEHTNEEYGGATVTDGTETMTIDQALATEGLLCIYPILWKWCCPCCGANGESNTPWGAAKAFVKHWKDTHPNGCHVSES